MAFCHITNSNSKKRTVQEMVEEVLLKSEKGMTPSEIHVGIKEFGYSGAPGNIHTRLHRWLKRGDTAIIKIGDGIYAHKTRVNENK